MNLTRSLFLWDEKWVAIMFGGPHLLCDVEGKVIHGTWDRTLEEFLLLIYFVVVVVVGFSSIITS